MLLENLLLLYGQCNAFELVHSVFMIFLFFEIDHRMCVGLCIYLQFCSFSVLTVYLCLDLMLTLSLMELVLYIPALQVRKDMWT